MTIASLPVTYTTKRPTTYDKDVIRVAVKRLLPEVVDWIKAGGDTNPNVQEIEEDLVDACHSAFNPDGYDIARRLDSDHMWSVDEQLVDTLSSFSFYISDACDAATKTWVATNKIDPPVPMNTRVLAKWGRETVEGTISKIYYDVARYLVQREKDEPGFGAIVYFESIVEVLEAGNGTASEEAAG